MTKALIVSTCGAMWFPDDRGFGYGIMTDQGAFNPSAVPMRLPATLMTSSARPMNHR